MAYTVSAGVNIYWEEHGSGTPVLLIMGLSFTHEMWFRILPELQNRCRVILFDNRGVGRSDAPKGVYSIRQMARDAAAVLDAAGAAAAHVIGASMGGMIAQEFALQFPLRVYSLLLACTSHGGVLARWPDFVRPKGLRWGAAYRREREQSLIPLLYSASTPQERIDEDIAVQCRSRLSYSGFLGQLSGILVWSSYRRLPAIHVPTIVIHGDRDRLIPSANGRTVASRIPGARFRLIEQAGHMLTTDQPDVCNQLIVEFLKQVHGVSSA